MIYFTSSTKNDFDILEKHFENASATSVDLNDSFEVCLPPLIVGHHNPLHPSHHLLTECKEMSIEVLKKPNIDYVVCREISINMEGNTQSLEDKDIYYKEKINNLRTKDDMGYRAVSQEFLEKLSALIIKEGEGGLDHIMRSNISVKKKPKENKDVVKILTTFECLRTLFSLTTYIIESIVGYAIDTGNYFLLDGLLVNLHSLAAKYAKELLAISSNTKLVGNNVIIDVINGKVKILLCYSSSEFLTDLVKNEFTYKRPEDLIKSESRKTIECYYEHCGGSLVLCPDRDEMAVRYFEHDERSACRIPKTFRKIMNTSEEKFFRTLPEDVGFPTKYWRIEECLCLPPYDTPIDE